MSCHRGERRLEVHLHRGTLGPMLFDEDDVLREPPREPKSRLVTVGPRHTYDVLTRKYVEVSDRGFCQRVSDVPASEC